jgi:hypothetical protein
MDMFAFVVALSDWFKREERQYRRDLRNWRKGNVFPCHLYPREKWPKAPYYRLVRVSEVLGRCPNCGIKLISGPETIFPKEYDCPFCQRSGEHPLYCGQTIELPPSKESVLKEG